MRDQLGNEFLRRCRGKFAIEFNNEQMGNTKITNQSDFVLGGGEQMRSILGPQNFRRMRIECNHHRGTVGGVSVTRGSGNDGLMAKVHAIEDTNREEERAAELG